jgi:hypothetical protein
MNLRERIKQILGDPNALTLFRVLAVPLIVALMYVPNRFTCLLAGLIFSAAAITDYFDGHLARQKNMVSNLGKVMDPVALSGNNSVVECDLAKVEVAGSNPVSRSIFFYTAA